MTTISNIFDDKYSYTYDDIIIHPGFINFSVNDVDLSTRLTNKIRLNIPLISSPMDTVTEHELAIKLALQGGLGIIHNNNTVEEQVKEVIKVKRYNNGFINDPITFTKDITISKIIDARKKYGFSSFPIVNKEGILLGSVSKRDVDFVENPNMVKVSKVMIPFKKLLKTNIGCSLEDAQRIIKSKKASKLFIVDSDNKLVSLICRKDIINTKNYPLATKCLKTNQLLVGAAVSTHIKDRKRIDRLCESNVDLIVIDSAQGNSVYQIQTIQYIKTNYPNVDLMAGNVVTSVQALNLIKYGVDVLRVGMGIGSICITQEVCGIGRGQCSAINDVKKISLKNNVSIVADGGIKGSGDIIKALTVGANAVMIGSLFAGTDEAPSDSIYENGIRLKKYRGMGSLEVMNSREETANRYYADGSEVHVAQGVCGKVMSKGSIRKYVPYLIKSIKHGFQDIGASSIPGLHGKVAMGEVKFELRSFSSIREGSVHSLFNFNH